MPSRRRFLAAGTVALAGLAGCTDSVALGTKPGENASNDTTGDADGEEASDTAEVLFTVSDGDEAVELATRDDVASVGEVEQSRTGDGYRLPVTLTDEGADAFADGLEAAGALDDPEAHEIRAHLDGEVIYSAGIGPNLAAAIADGKWDADPILLQVEDRETAGELRDFLAE